MHERVKQMEKDINDLKDNFARKEVDLSKTIDALKEDVGSSYVIGFEASMEQVAIIDPSVDLLEINPCKAMRNI